MAKHTSNLWGRWNRRLAPLFLDFVGVPDGQSMLDVGSGIGAVAGAVLSTTQTVEWISDSRTGVRLTDPEALLSTVVLQGAPELTSVARDARNRMQRVADSLSKP